MSTLQLFFESAWQIGRQDNGKLVNFPMPTNRRVRKKKKKKDSVRLLIPADDTAIRRPKVNVKFGIWLRCELTSVAHELSFAYQVAGTALKNFLREEQSRTADEMVKRPKKRSRRERWKWAVMRCRPESLVIR